jgi:hypothetical protein
MSAAVAIVMSGLNQRILALRGVMGRSLVQAKVGAKRQTASLGVRGDVIDECLDHVIESLLRRTYSATVCLPNRSTLDSLGENLAALVSAVSALSTSMCGRHCRLAVVPRYRRIEQQS